MHKSKHLHISDTLQFPRDFITETCAIIAQRRAGKTYTEAVIIEEMIAQQLPFVALDPTGASWGLRASADGKGEGLPVVIIGGAHADVPLEANSGALIADLVVDHPGYYVLDLSGGLEEDEQHQIALDFARRLFVRKQKERAPLHVFVDEADEFAKQTPMSKLDHACLRAFDRLCRRGGIFGIGMTFITQRPQVFNKDLLSQIGTLIVLRMVSPQDQDAIEGWVKRGVPKGLREEMMNSLSSLRKGEAWVLSPGYLEVFKRVQIRERRTFNSSATPTVGEQILVPQRLAAVDLAALGAQMRETLERAQQNDPAHLRAEIAKLKRELLTRPVERILETPEPQIEIQIIEKPVLNGQLPRLEAIFERAPEIIEPVTRVGDQLVAWGNDFNAALREVRDAINAFQARPPMPNNSRSTPTQMVARAIVRATAPQPRVPQVTAEAPSVAAEGLTKPQQRILDALALFQSLGIDAPDKSNVAVFADASPSSSAYQNNLGRLRTMALVDYPGAGKLALTAKGEARAYLPQRIATLADLHNAWFAKLSEPKNKILRALIAAYPHALTKEQCAELAGASATSSAYQNNLGNLRSLGLIDYRPQGHVVATKLLFPEGLR